MSEKAVAALLEIALCKVIDSPQLLERDDMLAAVILGRSLPNISIPELHEKVSERLIDACCDETVEGWKF